MTVYDDKDDMRKDAAMPISTNRQSSWQSGPTSTSTTPDGQPPGAQDLRCRKVSASLPWTVWLVCGVTICERWAYYGYVGPLQNYIQNTRSDPLRPGALGLGQSIASLIVNIFLIVSYTTPMGAGIIADTKLGRYKTVIVSLSLYTVGLAVLFITSLPWMVDHGAGLPGLIVALVINSLSLGGVKASLPPMLAEQANTVPGAQMKTLRNGERVIVDRDATLQYAFDVYYWCMNLGAQSRIAATFIAKDVGHWASNLMSLAAIVVGLLVLSLTRKHLVSEKLPGSLMVRSLKAFGIAIRHGCKMDAARPEVVAERDHKTVGWTSDFVDELQKLLFACRAFTPFIFFWLAQSEMTSNTVSQAAEMQTHGVPNDMLPVINSVTVILFMPIATHIIYPNLYKLNIRTPPLGRIAVGFLFETLGMAWAAGTQAWIYASPPCYNHPRACAASDGGAVPNTVNIGFQVPVYFFEGVSEVFASGAGYEYAFTLAPTSLKSVVQAVYALTAAGGSIIGAALTPVSRDPYLVGVYAGVAGTMFLATVAVAVMSWKYEGRRRSREKV